MAKGRHLRWDVFVEVMTRHQDVKWLLIGAAALLASLAGHAAQLALENMRFFGDVRAAYSHSLQTPLTQIALALLVIGALFIARGIIEGVREHYEDANWLVPALVALRDIPLAKLIAAVVTLQIASLTVGELTEQALSSYDGFGLTAIFGPGHLTAPFVHIAIGSLLALVLWAFAGAVCSNVRAVARLARAYIVWIARPAHVNCAPALRLLARRAESPAPPVLARHIASRPPPVFAALIA